MKTGTNRSNHIAFVNGLAIVAFAVGLVLALWGPDGDIPIRVAGAFSIAGGLFLFAAPRQSLIAQDPAVSAAEQIPAAHMVLRRLRIGGAAGVLMGVAWFVPNTQVSLALMLCGATVSMAGAFKVPRRFFVVKDGTGG